MTITGAAWIALLIGAGFAPPQAAAIARYSQREAGLDRGRFTPAVRLDPCARSRMGESLLGVTATLRRELRQWAQGSAACTPPQAQAAYIAWAFPRHYPACAAVFRAGDLDAFQRCWGRGHSR